MPISLEGYYSRGDDQIAKGYQRLLVRASRGAQSAEINEIQELTYDRIRRIAATVWDDGAVIKGELPVVNAETGEVTCYQSDIYIQGQVWTVPARTFTVATTGVVQIGVALNYSIVTEIQDATLKDPATGTRNFNQPGAARHKADPRWATDGDPFFVVYTIINGVLQTQQPPTNPFYELLARYDRESEGSYRVGGLTVKSLGVDGTFSIGAGVGNVFGYKVDLFNDSRVTFPVDPDLEAVVSEPDSFVNSSTPIQLSRFPVQAISSVVAVEEKTVTLTRGGSAGGVDSLPDSSILSIVDVEQGATTFAVTTDWLLVNDTIDWSPGGAEPAPGSSYDVTYRYYRAFTPTEVSLEAGTFKLSGAVAGQPVLTDYTWRVPRLDRICLTRDGGFIRVKGNASRYQLAPPLVPGTTLLLATVYQRWSYVDRPDIVHDGPRAAGTLNQNRLEELVVDLADMISRERLRWDVSSRYPTSKRGLFVDPMFDDDMRDAGIAQDAVIRESKLMLPSVSEVFTVAQNDQPWMLPYTEEVVVEQALETGNTLINPYVVFTPIPATLTLDPPFDSWTVVIRGDNDEPTEDRWDDWDGAEKKGEGNGTGDDERNEPD